MMPNELHIDKLFGVYRGTVLKHLPHGRCKIYIPAAYHEEYADKPDMLPSAEQAAPLFAGVNKGNGVFSYPNIGATVLCMFLNGDANLPVYFAATLGGENAFGQYAIIKKDLKEENGEEINSTEPISERHLVTSGKTHIEWYENGKISAIVEDPIRTICSVDYDNWEKGNDNISAVDKYQSKLSNDNVWKIRDDKLSNIDCQLVLDNNGDSHGKLSTSTHWYDIVDESNASAVSDGLDPTEISSNKGTISTDNWHVMHNNGEIKFGTLSTCLMTHIDKDGVVNSQVSVNNTYDLSVPGIMNHKVFQDETKNIVDAKTSSIIHSTLSAWTKEHHDISANVWIKSYRDEMFNQIDQSQTINTIGTLSNNFSMLSDGMLTLSANRKYTLISANKDTKEGSTKLENVSTSISTSTIGDAAFAMVSSLTKVDASAQQGGLTSLNVNLKNQLCMESKGQISIGTKLDKSQFIENGSTILIKNDAFSNCTMNVDGTSQHKAKWHYFQSIDDHTQDVDNNFVYSAKNKNNADVLEKMTSLKLIDGSPILDFKYNRKLEASTSTVDIVIADDIAQNEAVYLNNLSKGTTTLQIKSKTSGMKCTMTIDSFGKMTIQTTDRLDIQTTNNVLVKTSDCTVKADAITLDGPTTVTKTLHVVGATTIDSITTIKPDAVIGGKSFIGHMHVGNMGAPTSPPI